MIPGNKKPNKMPPKKKQVRNSYYFFMMEYKDREEARGNFFPGGLRDVSVAAAEEWNRKTPDERKPYENMAKQHKAEQRRTADKYTTLGTRFQTVDERARLAEEEKSIMYQTIEREIGSLGTKEALMDKLFYLMHVNYYCKVESTAMGGDIYYPAEIALVEFSLRCGTLNEYHTFVKTAVPFGWALAAKEQSEQTHEIPVEYEKGESRFYKILGDIKAFLMRGQPTRVFPPVYTMRDDRNLNTSAEAVKSTLHYLCDSMVPDEGHSVFRVFHLGKLLFELQKACALYDPKPAVGPPLQTLAENDLEIDNFSYWSGFACDFHEEIDRTLYCSLSVVKRWVYNICGHCCPMLDIPLIPGKHCPQQRLLQKVEAKRNRENWRGDYDNKERPEYRGSEQRSEATGNSFGLNRESDEENDTVVSGTKPEFASYTDSLKSKSSTVDRTSCWGPVNNQPKQQQRSSAFSEEDFPAIGQLSISESRNTRNTDFPAGGTLSMHDFPCIGRGRSQLGRGLGRGRSMQ